MSESDPFDKLQEAVELYDERHSRKPQGRPQRSERASKSAESPKCETPPKPESAAAPPQAEIPPQLAEPSGVEEPPKAERSSRRRRRSRRKKPAAVQDPVKVEESPKAEEPPKVEESPRSEEAPKAEETPKVEKRARRRRRSRGKRPAQAGTAASAEAIAGPGSVEAAEVSAPVEKPAAGETAATPSGPSQPSTEPLPKFTDYPFDKPLLDDIAEAGFVTPTPVQAQCIPHALAGRDVIGLAQTGTGKTAAFALPIIHRLGQQLEMGAVILAPTRELARQICGEFEKLGKSSGIRPALVVGGIPIEEDFKALRRWPNVLVATPGRLIDHIRGKSVVLSDVKVLVLDEADRMHDMGFIPQIRQIVRAVPEKRQTLMFTATMPKDVEDIVRQNMTDPVRVQIGRESAPAERAEQKLYAVSEKSKKDLLLQLLDEQGGRTLIFVRTKRGVERLASAIMSRHRRVGRLHSDRTQSDRDYAMAAFRDGRYRIMIATDVAARGIDVADIEHVINFDFPHSPEDYVHRIGRTARVEASGVATTFVAAADAKYLKRLEKLLAKKIDLVPTPGCDDVAAAAERSSSGRSRRSGGSGRSSSRRPGRRGGRSRGKKPETAHAG